MALNINWRFAGPQNINVPQSNFLQSLDKNIQNALGIKKEFEKKRDDNEMIRLMTEESENKLTNLINEKDELTTQYNSLSPDEQFAQKTNYENKLKELDIQIESARKEAVDAKMNANQFKTTGTTDFFRWKKDKEYASDVAAMNRDMLNEQNKQEDLSNLYWDIQRKQSELEKAKKTYDIDKENEIIDELNILYGRYNETAGKEFYKPLEKKQKKTSEGKDDGKGQNNPPEGKDDPRRVESIEKSIENLKWEQDLDNCKTVDDLRTEIGQYNYNEGKKLAETLADKLEKLKEEKVEELINNLKLGKDFEDKVENIKAEIGKIKNNTNLQGSLNDMLTAKIEELKIAKAKKDKDAAEAKQTEEDKLKTMRNKGKAQELLDYSLEEKNLEDHRNSAEKYLIEVLGNTPYDKKDPRRDTPLQAAYTKYKDNVPMRRFIKNNTVAINAIQPAEK